MPDYRIYAHVFMSESMLTGSLVAIVTPMLPDGALDFARLKSLIDWHIAVAPTVSSLWAPRVNRQQLILTSMLR